MKICAVSDLHGHFPNIPDCDLLLLGGDYCPYTKDQFWWFRDSFGPWLESLSSRMQVVGVAGNHDLIFEKKDAVIPKMQWIYLQDSGCEFKGYKIWGSPHQNRYFDWAFNADEPELMQYWNMIPNDTDILLLHGPPFGYGDFSPHGSERTGSPSLTERIMEIQPKLVIAGHIHSGYGSYMIGQTQFYNAAYVDEKYQPKNVVWEIDI